MRFFYFIILFLNLTVFSQTIKVNDSIKEYVDFLNNEKYLSPKEYIFKQFETNDIVILSERHHADTTQYELIKSILKDNRFKGAIYTEVGTFNSLKLINQFLLKENLTEKEKKQSLLAVYRDIDFYIVWEKYNYYDLLSSIYDINQHRKKEEKIFLIPLDVEFHWDKLINHEQYQLFDDYTNDNTVNRDLEMGKHFAKAYSYLSNKYPNKKKALVILNVYHGYTRIPTFLPLPTRPDIYSSAEFIYKTYPNKTKGILINTVNYVKKELVEKGKWDAAFKLTGNKNVGFDIKDTPFGKTKFDLYDFGGSDYDKVNFEYIFDGFIFYKPINEFVLAWGIPDIYTEENEDQYFKRLSIIEGIPMEQIRTKENEEDLKELNKLNYTKIEHLDLYEEQINSWIISSKP